MHLQAASAAMHPTSRGVPASGGNWAADPLQDARKQVYDSVYETCKNSKVKFLFMRIVQLHESRSYTLLAGGLVAILTVISCMSGLQTHFFSTQRSNFLREQNRCASSNARRNRKHGPCQIIISLSESVHGTDSISFIKEELAI